MEAVAKRAKVSKPSIYRRWPNLVQLAYAVRLRATLPGQLPDTGTFAGDLRVMLRALAAAAQRTDRMLLADQYAEMVRDPDFADAVLSDPVRAQATWICERAIERGEVRADLDPREVMLDAAGAIILRAVLLHQPLDTQGVDAIVDRLVHGVLAR